jgi:predicted nucleic acid-binding protein
MERTGQRIGAMDLLIATAALVDAAPVVTRNRNVQDFSRIPGLEVVTLLRLAPGTSASP